MAAWRAWAYMQLPDTFKEIWGWFMAGLIIYFLMTFIEALAQMKLDQTRARTEVKED